MPGHPLSLRAATASEKSTDKNAPIPIGYLALRHWNKSLPLQVLLCSKGYYIGTIDTDGTPQSRESVQLWLDKDKAVDALASGMWTQKMVP